METGSNYNGWQIEDLLGEGSFGKVYRITRSEFGNTYESALKVIKIPQSQAEIESVRNDDMDENSITSYFESIVQDIAKELNFMYKLKGITNIVSYEDHRITPVENGIGWDIYIRMELLTPLFTHIRNNEFSIREILKLGIDICEALEICGRFNIIHRDIKPENIFVSFLGDFKLGDFGIARQLEKTASDLSKKGTYTYMAPEVYLGKPYNSTVDIYSLGIVLYRFLNNNRTPFLPAFPEPIKFSDKEQANIMRISGKPIPKPVNANDELSDIILKACSYNPDDRYQTPAQMKAELMAVLNKGDFDAVPADTFINDSTLIQEDNSVIEKCKGDSPDESSDASSEEHHEEIVEHTVSIFSNGKPFNKADCKPDNIDIIPEIKETATDSESNSDTESELSVNPDISEQPAEAQVVEAATDETQLPANNETPEPEPVTTFNDRPVRFCSRCGSSLSGTSKVCSACGASIVGDWEKAPDPAPPHTTNVAEKNTPTSYTSINAKGFKTCSRCGASVSGNSSVCSCCGATIAKTKQTATTFGVNTPSIKKTPATNNVSVNTTLSHDTPSIATKGFKTCSNCGGRVSASSSVCSCCGYSFSKSNGSSPSDWFCQRCGRKNSRFVSTCACGNTRNK